MQQLTRHSTLHSDTSNLFQSDAQHARAAFRAAKSLLHAESGDPIKLGSKPLRVVVRQKPGKEAEAWVAESGFVVRRLGLEVSEDRVRAVWSRYRVY